MKQNLEINIQRILAAIEQAEQVVKIPKGTTQIIAVTKTRTIEEMTQAYQLGLKHFGENYLQEALPKIKALENLDIQWHFIGHIQSNKTKEIAESFSWVQSIDRVAVAKRLNNQRSSHLPPLNGLIQVNIDDESSKSGIKPDDVIPFAEQFKNFPRLTLRGLMTIPKAATTPELTAQSFVAMMALYKQLQEAGFLIDTLSMGMSNDFATAIAHGANMIRLGTAFFGPR